MELEINWLDWTKAVFDLLKGIAWPVSILSVVWIFRQEVRERIKDIISVGPSGAVLQVPKQPTVAKPATGLAETQHPLATVKALIDKIGVQLNDTPEDERIPKLVINLAEAQIERGFEFIWGLIFGSQVTALRRLKEQGPIPVDEAKRLYEKEVLPANKELLPDWDFDQWTLFLKNQQLVKLENDQFSLTDLGRDFLAFVDLRKQGASKSL
ncbi:hypothetical protein E0H35_25655 [Rhizobium leguminosarum bv. viciae]|uniref:hypothetical protein n=1 Tax=Rhizobium leguminosarum TaxID=384 RepID=UPI00103C893E|nr:hypothetical protein [Rhizobium leguminosarum]TBY93582.1 hypothetical protein E0H35_25655 [Rhizobium leguminosarum bv. viciae]